MCCFPYIFSQFPPGPIWPLMHVELSRSRNTAFILYSEFIFKHLTQPFTLFFRTQNLHCGSWQCWQNDNPVSVPDERGCPHLAHNWVQRGRGCVEKCPFYHVGPRRPRITQSSLEYLLLKHRSNYILTVDFGHFLDKIRHLAQIKSIVYLDFQI